MKRILLVLLTVSFLFVSSQSGVEAFTDPCDTSSFNTVSNFVVKVDGTPVAALDIQGYWRISGDIFESQGVINRPNSFTIKDSSGTVVAAIDRTGNLYLLGTVDDVNPTPAPTAGQDLIIQYGGTYLTVFDEVGNMQTGRCIERNAPVILS